MFRGAELAASRACCRNAKSQDARPLPVNTYTESRTATDSCHTIRSSKRFAAATRERQHTQCRQKSLTNCGTDRSTVQSLQRVTAAPLSLSAYDTGPCRPERMLRFAEPVELVKPRRTLQNP